MKTPLMVRGPTSGGLSVCILKRKMEVTVPTTQRMERVMVP